MGPLAPSTFRTRRPGTSAPTRPGRSARRSGRAGSGRAVDVSRRRIAQAGSGAGTSRGRQLRSWAIAASALEETMDSVAVPGFDRSAAKPAETAGLALLAQAPAVMFTTYKRDGSPV